VPLPLIRLQCSEDRSRSPKSLCPNTPEVGSPRDSMCVCVCVHQLCPQSAIPSSVNRNTRSKKPREPRMGMRDGEIDDPDDGIGEGFVRDRRKEGGGKTRPKQQRQEDADDCPLFHHLPKHQLNPPRSGQKGRSPFTSIPVYGLVWSGPVPKIAQQMQRQKTRERDSCEKVKSQPAESP